MRASFTPLLLISVLLLLLTGCGEGESVQIRKARLMANENLEFREQIDEKEQQIQLLKEKLDQSIAQQEKMIQEADEANTGLLELIEDAEKRFKSLTDENQKLREELNKP